MKQVVFISGKGGTGKSTVTAALSRIAQHKMLADCDVDAPNLHMLLDGKLIKKDDYYGAERAAIDESKCIYCGQCLSVCRFDAISEDLKINPFKCEGCAACTLVCPVQAISLHSVKTGETYLSDTQYGTFSDALLQTGAEGSGKLVTEVRKNMLSAKDGEQWAIVDGSPGTGCPVISSISGADAVVAVCEPTKSGQSDLVRVLAVAKHFGIPAYVCINKYDLNLGITQEIEVYCSENGFPVIGKIPFEPRIINALQSLQTPVEAGIENVTAEITRLWQSLKEELSS